MIKIMGIQNYLKRVSKATKDIKSAIEEKGVPVAMCDGYEQLADKVRAIQVGSSVEASDMLFTMLAFKQSTSMPGTPTGGSFSETKITYPSGWSDGAGLTENVWMSYCVIKGDGSVYKNWVTPIKLSGISASDIPSVDLTDYALKSWVTEQISKLDFNDYIDLSAYATKTYVQNEIAKIQTGGSVDLSNYATKSYVDSGDASTLSSSKKYTDDEIAKLPGGGGTFVKSVNDLNGDVTLAGSSSVTITKSGNTLTFTAKGGSGSGGDDGDGTVYRTFRIYKLTDSDSDIPAISSSPAPKWDQIANTLTNIPSGWSLSVEDSSDKFIWMAIGTFSSSTNGLVGDWEGPVCLNKKGKPGDPGADGRYTQEVYCLTNESNPPSVNELSADSNGHTRNDDDYLPKFVFTSKTIEAVKTKQSVDSNNRYLWGTSRSGVSGNWGNFCSPYLVNNFVLASMSEEDKEAIKDEVSREITDALNRAEDRVKDIEQRVDKIDGTDATFFIDKEDALISAITQYKEANKKAFADLIVDGKQADIKLWAGAVVDEKVTGESIIKKISDAGIDLNGMEGKLDLWADYEEKTDQAIQKLGSVETQMNAQEGRISDIATYTGFTNSGQEGLVSKFTNMAKNTLDAAKAEIRATVATGTWIWAALDNEIDRKNAEDASYTLIGKVLKTKPYDTREFLTWTDESGVVHEPAAKYAPEYDSEGKLVKSGEEKYRESIEGTYTTIDGKTYPWTRMVAATALSRIIQQPGKITLEALAEAGKDENGKVKNNLASIVLNAIGTDGKSEIDFDAANCYFTGNVEAKGLTAKNLKVSGQPDDATEGVLPDDEKDFGAAITYAAIHECKIANCAIENVLQSKGYTSTTENGFYFDATDTPNTVLSNDKFRLAGSWTKNGKKYQFEMTEKSLEIPAAAITDLTVDTLKSSNYRDGTKAGFKLDSTRNTFEFYGPVVEGDQAIITNEKIQIPAATITGTLTADQIDVGDITVTSLQSKGFTAPSEDGKTVTPGFRIDSEATGSTPKFQFYGNSADGMFRLTENELVIPSASIKNLTAENISDFESAVNNALFKVEGSTAQLSSLITTVLADQADITAKSLSTSNNGRDIKIGTDVETSTVQSVNFCNSYSTDEKHFNDTGTWDAGGPFYSNTIYCQSGCTLWVPAIRIGAWAWNAYAGGSGLRRFKIQLWNKTAGSAVSGTSQTLTADTWNGDGSKTVATYSKAFTQSISSAGEYCIQFTAEIGHPSDNWSGWSKAKFFYDGFTLKTVYESSNGPGVYLSPTAFMIKSSDTASSTTISECSVDCTSSSLKSTGFVLSPTISRIQVITSEGEAGSSEDTLYIMLN